MKKRISGFGKIAILTLMIALIVTSAAISTIASSGSVATVGRNFKNNNAASNLDQRLELTTPLEAVPLTFEATVKYDTISECFGTIFGQYGGNGVNCTFNFELHTNSPALCYASSDNASSMSSVVFGNSKHATPILDKNGNSNTLSDHIGEWTHIAIVATPVGTNVYNFDCYINGEKAYTTVTNRTAYLTEANLEKSQNSNRFALGANAVASDPVEFRGSVKNVALYANTLTEEQIGESYANGVSAIGTGLIAHYDMSVVESLWYEEDLSGNGYNLARADKVYNVNSEGRTFFGERLALTKPITESPLTIEAVIKTTATGATIFGNNISSSKGCLNFEIYGGNPALCFPVSTSGSRGSVIFNTPLKGVTPFSPNSEAKDDFTYLAITATPTGAANTYAFDCYVNGVKAYETITKVAYLDPALIQTSGALAIGSSAASGNFFNGNIRSVNLYNRPLTAAEIRASYLFKTTYDGMIAGYDMSDSSHNRNPQFEADISGNGYHAQKATNNTTGKWFDSTAGGDKFVDNAANANPYFVHNLITEMPRTYEATVYPIGNTDGPYNATIFGNYPNGNDACINLEFFKQRVYLCLWGYNDAGKLVKDTVPFSNYIPTANQWTHFVVVNEIVDGKSVYKLYANGELVDTVTAYPNVRYLIDSQTSTRKFSLGGSGKTNLNGGLIDFALYSDALTAEEVMDSFKNGVNKRDENLILYYDLKSVAGADFIQDLSGNNHHASRNDYTAIEGGRWFNYDEERLAVVKNYEEAPLTINAEVYVPSTLTQAATIFGNFYSRDYINFEIYTNGRPALVIHELPENLINQAGGGYKHSVIFDVDVRAEKWTDLTVVYDKTKTGTDKYALYVDGVKVESYSLSSDSADINHVFELDMEWIQRAIPFTLGRNASRCFQGKIKNLALYSEPLTSVEVAALYENGVDMTSKSLFAYYNLDNPENTKTYVKDETGNGYDFAYKFYENESNLGDDDFDYSFAFIGDTQFLVYKDINEGTTKYTKPIYDWLIKNKDEKKLQYVFGLGDVSDKDYLAEYKYASYLYKTLGDAGINYAVTPGNHDGQTAYVNYNSVFTTDSYLANGINYYTDGNVSNYYKTFEVGEYKYMVMVLEFGAPNAVLEWANGVVAANPDRQVIVLTHGYIGYDGGFLSEGELHSPGRNSALNSGEELWQKFVSLHSNIIISACGHIDPYNIKHREDVGVNGNTVQQFLIDPQALDKTWSYDTGMVAMFYFSNGGKDVRVEYVSATQSLRAEANDPDANDIVFGKENQFNFTLDVPDAEKVMTPYGELPYINTDLDLNAVVLFKNDAASATGYAFVGGYSSVDKAFSAMLADDLGGSYTVLLRDNARMSSKVAFNNFVGNLTLDLGGYELKIDENGNYLFDIYRNNATSISATYNVKNGSITKVHGRGVSCINYGASIGADSNLYFNYSNVTFKSINSIYVPNAIFSNWENGWSDSIAYNMNVNACFNDCTFDLRNSADGTLMFSLTNTSNNGSVAKYDVTVNGGIIVVEDGAELAGLYTADALDSFKFGKTADGNYTAVSILKGNSAPTEKYNGLEFVKVSETVDEVIYRLRPEAVAGINYAPKMSITLASELVMNVYIPANCTEKFTFNGTTYENLEAIANKKVTVDGNDYYLLKVALGSAEAAKEIKLAATVNIGDTTATATFTFSIPKYAVKVLVAGNDVEKTLAKDVLAYVKAAYNYFTEFNSADEIARVNALVDSIIGADYTSVPVSTGVTNTIAPVTAVTLNLEAKPSIRFYVADTTVSLYADGVKLNTVSGTDANGAYVELDVYAYALCETITYGEGGSYHISNFLANAHGTDYEELVKAFVKYTESAANYRNEVMGK